VGGKHSARQLNEGLQRRNPISDDDDAQQWPVTTDEETRNWRIEKNVRSADVERLLFSSTGIRCVDLSTKSTVEKQ
jgi:hypothetical protein